MDEDVINLWDFLIADVQVPDTTVQRFLERRRVFREGVDVSGIPTEDLPHLARHTKPR